MFEFQVMSWAYETEFAQAIDKHVSFDWTVYVVQLAVAELTPWVVVLVLAWAVVCAREAAVNA